MNNLIVKLNSHDNVAIAVKPLTKGETVTESLTALDDIPQAHKIALCDIKKGAEILRYNTVIGYANKDIKKGQWINQYMVTLPTAPSLDNMEFGTNIVTELPTPPRTSWLGYPNPNGGPAGTRNILGIMTTVQCATGVVNAAVKKIRAEFFD